MRDANQNVTANDFYEGFTNVAAAGTTTTLTASSTPNFVVTGSGGQTYQLPDATTLPSGAIYTFNNNQSSGTIVVKNNSGTTIVTVQSGSFVEIILLSNSIAAGSWDYHYQAPSNVSWSTNTLSWAGTYTNGTWYGRNNPRVSVTTSSASAVTPDISAYDEYAWTAQAATLTINAPTGTPVDGNKLIFRILDNGTPQTLSWNATFTVIGVTLPTTTTASKTTYVGCIYNVNNSRWDVIAVTTQV